MSDAMSGGVSPADLAARVKAIVSGLETANEEREDIREELAAERERREALEREVAELKDRTAIFERASSVGAYDAEQKAALCIQAAANEARRREEKGEPAIGTLTIREGWATLNKEIDRTTTYDIFEKAAALVEGDVVQYHSERPGTPDPSRLEVNLEKGPLSENLGGLANGGE